MTMSDNDEKLYAVRLNRRLLGELENVLSAASSRESDPDADVIQLLDLVRKVRRQAISDIGG